jgi:hypothetical protein
VDPGGGLELVCGPGREPQTHRPVTGVPPDLRRRGKA